MKTIIAFALAFTSLNAFATGGFSCTADDATLKFEVSGVTTHGMGSPIVTADGSLVYQPADGVPPIASFGFKEANVSQYWNHGGALNLVLYTEDYGAKDTYETTLVIETVTKDDGETFTGTYTASTYQNIGGTPASHEASGAVTCSVE